MDRESLGEVMMPAPKYITKAIIVRRIYKGKPIHWSKHRFYNMEHLLRFKKEGERLYPDTEFHIVDVLNATPPIGAKVKKHRDQLWCPYCSEYRNFIPYDYLGTVNCEVCEISTKDQYVRTFNGLWSKEFTASSEKKEKKKLTPEEKKRRRKERREARKRKLEEE